jgi:hypothetical protein
LTRHDDEGYAFSMSIFGIETLTLALPDETPAEADEREAVQAGALDYSDATAVWAEQEAFEAWVDDEQERVQFEMERDMMERGIF